MPGDSSPEPEPREDVETTGTAKTSATQPERAEKRDACTRCYCAILLDLELV